MHSYNPTKKSTQKRRHHHNLPLAKINNHVSNGSMLAWCSLKDQMVRYDQEKNVISATSSYSHDISNEVLHTEKTVKQIPLRVADKLNCSNVIQPRLTRHELH